MQNKRSEPEDSDLKVILKAILVLKSKQQCVITNINKTTQNFFDFKGIFLCLKLIYFLKFKKEILL